MNRTIQNKPQSFGRLPNGGLAQRLRTLRELLAAHEIGLSDLASASRLRRDPGLREATDAWLEAKAERPVDVPAADWMRWEQEKHQRLLDAAALTAAP